MYSFKWDKTMDDELKYTPNDAKHKIATLVDLD